MATPTMILTMNPTTIRTTPTPPNFAGFTVRITMILITITPRDILSGTIMEVRITVGT